MSKAKRVFFFKLFLVLVAVALFIVPAAAGAPEIERRVLASVLGIDRTDDTYTLTAQVVVPKRSGEGEPVQEVVTAEGRSVAEGIDKLNRALGRSIELGHCGVIVLGDMPDVSDLSYFLAGGIVTAGTHLVSVDNAGDFIESIKGMSASAITGLDGFIAYSTSSASSATRDLMGFVSDSAAPSATSYMPILEADEKSQGQSGGSGGGQSGDQSASAVQAAANESGGGGGGEKKTPTIKSAERTAIFVDNKKVGEFSEEQTRGLAWIDRTSTRGFVELDDFTEGDRHYGGVYAQLKSKSAKIKPYFKAGAPFVKVKIRCKLELEDKHKLNELAAELGETAASKVMQDAFAKLIQSEIGSSMIRAGELNADPFGIRTAFFQYEHDRYVKYSPDAFLSDVRLEFDVKVKIV